MMLSGLGASLTTQQADNFVTSAYQAVLQRNPGSLVPLATDIDQLMTGAMSQDQFIQILLGLPEYTASSADQAAWAAEGGESGFFANLNSSDVWTRPAKPIVIAPTVDKVITYTEGASPVVYAGGGGPIPTGNGGQLIPGPGGAPSLPPGAASGSITGTAAASSGSSAWLWLGGAAVAAYLIWGSK